jgi:hypothetical protein
MSFQRIKQNDETFDYKDAFNILSFNSKDQNM